MTIINAFIFLLIALVYSSAGFGGGSMYLAVLSQLGLPESVVRLNGLSCNALVTATGTFNFHRGKWIVWKKVFMLLVFSTPACVLASLIDLKTDSYFLILAACLFIAGLITLFAKRSNTNSAFTGGKDKWWLYPLSMLIGFISGITGIGGGVYLAPLLHLIRWGSAKHIAAASSVYILVNSVAGLCVLVYKNGIPELADTLLLMLAVLVGGLIGSRLSSNLFSQKTVRILTGSLIIFAAIKIFVRYL